MRHEWNDRLAIGPLLVLIDLTLGNALIELVLLLRLVEMLEGTLLDGVTVAAVVVPDPSVGLVTVVRG